MTQTTVELTEELLPQAVLDEQEADRKERTYKNIDDEFDIEASLLYEVDEPKAEPRLTIFDEKADF